MNDPIPLITEITKSGQPIKEIEEVFTGWVVFIHVHQ